MNCFLQTTLGLLFFSVCLAVKISLYGDTDPLYQLDSTNFHNTVLGKNNAWIIEFYNNWCGHCIRFAPTWIMFARDIRTWKTVYKVGVVNCNDDQNVKLCRQYEVESYPTIKLFWHHVNETDLGEVLSGERKIYNIQKKMIEFLEDNWDKGVPPEWPDIRPLPMETLENIPHLMPESRQSMMLYIETADSLTGRKVILDMSWQVNVILRTVLISSTKLMRDLNLKVAFDTVPALLRIFRNGFQIPLLKFTQNDTGQYIRNQIYQHVIGTPRNETKFEDFLPKPKLATHVSITNAVYMTDIENAVYYSLSQEIGVTKSIVGEKFSAMKAFLSILKTYFPGTPPAMAYLSNLYNWILYKNSISGEEFVQAMEEMQGETAQLPKMREWVGCKGSELRYRGYPCSLWTLFHTLTVQADIVPESHSNMDQDPSNVLFVIKDYVKNFFTCEECATNFLEMAENIANTVNSSQDGVLWLWEAHNKVNNRLSGDVTEDPKHPKLQFPSVNDCLECQTKDANTEDITWNKGLVLKYLHNFYSKSNIVRQDKIKVQVPFSADQKLTLNNSAMVNTFKNVSLDEKWNFQWFTNTDISLCVSLYLVSALLLIVIFLLFRQRRRRRKSQLGRYQKFP